MGFSRQEYWSGLPFPSPGNLPNPGIEPRSPTLQADSLLSEPADSKPPPISSENQNQEENRLPRPLVKDREAWHAAVSGDTKSQTALSE